MSANELIERLADEEDLCWNEGAEDIARLLADARTEIKRLREALEPFARAEHIVASCDDRIRCTLTYPKDATETFTLGSLEAARRALKVTGADPG